MPSPPLLNLQSIGRLKPHQPTVAELQRLLAAAERNLKDAHVTAVSDETRFDAAYKAIMQCALIGMMASAVFDAICDIKPRLFGLGRVANPRDTTRYRCGLRLAQTKNPSVLFVASSIKHCTSGFRPATNEPGHHQTLIQTLSHTLGVPAESWIVLDALRRRRNANDYTGDIVTPDMVSECIAQAQALLPLARAKVPAA